MERRASFGATRPALLVRLVALLVPVLLLSGCGSLAAFTGSSSPRTVGGRVRDDIGPILGARVTLTAYQSDRCVALARRAEPPSEDERRELRECVRPLAEAVTGEAGTFTFPNVRPGAYDVTIVWALPLASRCRPIPSSLRTASRWRS